MSTTVSNDRTDLDTPGTGAAATGSANSVELRGIEKRYGQVAAVCDLDLQVRAGEFLTLLGSSGSGKTTTLMMVAGFERPTTGSITIERRDMAGVPAHKRNVGVVFQNYALFPHMTVRENIAFPLKMRTTPAKEIDRLGDAALQMVQLGDHHGRYPHELSGGQQQRVALARATVYRPALLLMDEPLSALDRKLRLHMQYEIKRIHRELGTSVIYVTHDQDEALGLSDRIALMHDGRLEQIDTPEQLYRRPKTAFSAWFLGESNFLEGTAVGAADEGKLLTIKLSDGGRVAATASCAIANGSKVRMSIRPEQLNMTREARRGDGPASVQVLLEESVYQGGSVRCHGSFAAGGECTIRTNAAEAREILDARSIWVTWSGDDATVFPKTDEALGPELS